MIVWLPVARIPIASQFSITSRPGAVARQQKHASAGGRALVVFERGADTEIIDHRRERAKHLLAVDPIAAGHFAGLGVGRKDRAERARPRCKAVEAASACGPTFSRYNPFLRCGHERSIEAHRVEMHVDCEGGSAASLYELLLGQDKGEWIDAPAAVLFWAWSSPCSRLP